MAGLALLWSRGSGAAELQLPVLRTKTGNYTNVTVYGRSNTDLYVRHSRGLCNIKLADLPPETLAALGPDYAAAVPAKARRNVNPMQVLASPALQDLKTGLGRELAPRVAVIPGISTFRPGSSLLLILLAVMLAGYLFFCYCLKLICEKAGHRPGGLVWIPILQMIPMLQAAGMSGWWLLAFLVPGLNLVAHILWSIKIVQARRKNLWVSLLLILPVTNLAAFLYLAFSSAAESDDEENTPTRISITPPVLGEA